MSEYAQQDDSSSSPPRHGSGDTNLHNISLEDAANNSIIGKVKSRVSSILPNRLSKWFSPSAKLQNDSLNGSICGPNINTLPTRRRRRIEIDDEDNYEDDEDVQRSGEYEENNHRLYVKQTQNRQREIDVDDENDEDDESQNSEDEYNSNNITKQTRRDLNVERQQPPAKRSRLNIDVRDSPLLTRHQPLLSSTPAVGSAYLRNSGSTASASRSSYQRYTNLNLYGNQSKKEPAYNFGQQKESKQLTKINADIIDLISNPSYEHDDKLAETSNAYGGSRTGISSRKSLNIPSSGSTLSSVERVYATVAHLKRQPLSTAKTDLSAATTHTMGIPPRRTSTTIHEVQDQESEDNDGDGTGKTSEDLLETNANTCNGSSNNFAANKRQKLINGTGLNAAALPESNEAILIDSASESGESAMDVMKTNASNKQQQRKTGLFNMSAAANTRNSSRTSSFGNGLNFYSHLEGRKSLFSGPNHGISNPLNNSTLSLTSLNRRQFNASIYGSTSALSDSRLLNTFSPFYKGKTTYGGAAAYNKYTAGAGASSVRITPTLIRPTSSLSTLSSSNTSMAAANNISSQMGDNSSTISSTAKRILDLINDFATPLSEAKKMASSLKSNPNLQIPPQAKGRLNEGDLNASRAMRLSQVRTPYARPAVILQPSGNASGRAGTAGGLMPPIKELQVPTMSQLLQMKKIQNTTEKARKIAQNAVVNSGTTSEYTLPEMANAKTNEQDQQKHTNKIKNKVTNSMRPSAAVKDLQDEEPPPPVNLPNIAFPLMQSVPKIDIQLNKQPSVSSSTTTTFEFKTSKEPSKLNSFVSNPTPMKPLTQTSVSTTDSKKTQSVPIQSLNTISASTLKTTTNTFKFSEPLQVAGVSTPTQRVTKNDIDKYKFSPPLDVIVTPTSYKSEKLYNTQPKQPQLKEGSCLDALSKPFTLPPTTTKTNIPDQTSSINGSLSVASSGFGNQFKKSSNEWECDACMIRNKSDANKCVACETPRTQKSSETNQQPINTSLSLTTPITSTFGQQFKKSSNEWECDACMIRNKQDSTKCVACETPRKGAPPQSTTTTALLPPIKTNSFGDAFKPKSGTWECETCMISNKNEANECIACQTKKPGAKGTTNSTTAAVASQFKFGFAAATNNTNSNADSGFKTLAAQQKASKWECDACMTRNDANRTKCACCEQPKPGATSAEPSNTSSTKFQFGATAASKFSFGFGTGANTPKEEDLRKGLSSKPEDNTKAAASVPAQGGFQFGIKPITSTTTESNKDEADSNKQMTGFKFGVSTASKTDTPKLSETSAVSSAPTSFAFGSSKPLTTSATTTPVATKSTPALSSAASTPSVKFTLPATSTNTTSSGNNDKPTGVAAPTFGFGTSTASSTTGGFSFGSKIETAKPIATTVVEEKKSLDSFAFKAPTTLAATTPKSSGFVFGSSTINSSSATTAATTVSSSINTTTSTSTSATTSTTSSTITAAAAVKPMFSFGSPASTTPAANSQATSGFGGFSFGSNSTNNAAATTTTANTLFAAAVTSTTTISTTANVTSTASLSSTTTTTTPASTNIFGSFGGGGGGGSSNAPATPIFGSSINPPANNNNNLTTVSSSTNNSTSANTPQFGTFGSKTTSNVFGSFGGVGGNNSTLVKPKETKPTLPVFGNVAPTSTSQSSQSNSSGFVFGSNTMNNSATTTTASTGSVTSTSTTWPKNSFVFGSTATATSPPTNSAAAANSSENKEVAKPSAFGTFGSSSTSTTNQQQTSSIFGVTASASGAAAAASVPTNSSTNLFGSNSAPAATSIFGANSSGNAATPAPAFGSSPFGGAASSTSATPTFGSTAASGASTFGGFGGTTNNTTTNTSDVKKPEAAFNFGAAPAAQNTSGGFNFGSSASTTKPAFNFGGTTTTQQPTFNFTGTAESQNSTKPFQFGATPAAPVFNFNRGALEGTPNAPFQFNAGAAPVTSNIFAPAPTPGAQTAQQAKRKIRAPIRRVTQR